MPFPLPIRSQTHHFESGRKKKRRNRSNRSRTAPPTNPARRCAGADFPLSPPGLRRHSPPPPPPGPGRGDAPPPPAGAPPHSHLIGPFPCPGGASSLPRPPKPGAAAASPPSRGRAGELRLLLLHLLLLLRVARPPPARGVPGAMEVPRLPLALGLAALLLGLSSAVLEVEVAHSSVVVIEGHRATLPVAYTTHSNGEPYVTWHLQRPGSPHPFQILVYMSGKTRVEDLDLQQRLDFLYHMPSHNVSLAINNTKETDSGQYMCTVNVAGESTKIGKNTGLVNLTVLVPPSPPKCQIHGSPHVGGNITLTCRSVVGKPAPKYWWQQTSPTPQVFHAPTQDDVKGILTLTNLTTKMSGVYVCKAFSNAGYSNCSITLAVNPPVNAAVVAGAVAGTLIGLGLIILFPLQMLAYRRRKKEAQEEMANEIKEDAVAPKTLSWAKSPGSDTVSKNGTLSSMNTTRDHHLYASKPASDTASITTATGSTVGFKPPFNNSRSGTLTPTPSLSSQSLPLYFPPMANGVHCHHVNMSSHRNTLQRTNRAQPQAPRQQEPTAAQGLTTSTLNRMGAVPVMVPAQSQAGSLV